jgi:DnaK suppressor protein
MAKSRREQRRTDRQRIAPRGTGKLDRDATQDRDVGSRVAEQANRERIDAAAGPSPAAARQSIDELRARLLKSRDEAADQLRRRGRSPEGDDNAPRPRADTVLDEADEAQQSERHDLVYATRQRMAERINQLTAALERMQAETYGECIVCRGRIEPARLAAIPEAETCLRCQAERERTEPERAA